MRLSSYYRQLRQWLICASLNDYSNIADINDYAVVEI